MSKPIRQPVPAKNGPHSEKTPANKGGTEMSGPIRKSATLSKSTGSKSGTKTEKSVRSVSSTIKL